MNGCWLLLHGLKRIGWQVVGGLKCVDKTGILMGFFRINMGSINTVEKRLNHLRS